MNSCFGNDLWVRLKCVRSTEGVWHRDGAPGRLADLPLPDKLIDRFRRWRERHETFYNDGSRIADDEIAAFAAEGLAVATAIKFALPAWTIIYFDVSRSRQSFPAMQDRAPSGRDMSSQDCEYEILLYRGSTKHKQRPARRKGTICPEWTHEPDGLRLGTSGLAHPWERTVAAVLLQGSRADPRGGRKRFATRQGMAFVANDTADGTWHGYPVPWNDVPTELKDTWRKEGLVSRRDLKRYSEFPRDDFAWPLSSDDD